MRLTPAAVLPPRCRVLCSSVFFEASTEDAKGAGTLTISMYESGASMGSWLHWNAMSADTAHRLNASLNRRRDTQKRLQRQVRTEVERDLQVVLGDDLHGLLRVDVVAVVVDVPLHRAVGAHAVVGAVQTPAGLVRCSHT